jgi:hypothetical protein
MAEHAAERENPFEEQREASGSLSEPTSDSVQREEDHQHESRHVLASTTPRPVSQTLVSPFLRAENEDDDGYDPFSDRPPAQEALFERDPWA